MRKTFFPKGGGPFPQTTIGRAQGSPSRPLGHSLADRLPRRRTPPERPRSPGLLIATLVILIVAFAAAAAWHLLR